MRIDPVATLRCWRIDVDVAGTTHTIPPLTAADWMLVVVDGTWADIIPGLLPEAGGLDDAIVDGRVTSAECKTAARAALAAASGCTWWTAQRLAAAAVDSWVGGEVTLRGVDPSRLSLAAYLAAVYRAATREMDEQQRARFDMQLEQPPQGVDPEEWWDDGRAADNFMSVMGAPGG